MVILLVEDDPLIALAVAGELEAAGHKVVGPAHDEGAAMRLAQADHPDIALVDIDLGEGGDGVALARMLKRAGVLPVFATGERARARANRDTALGCLAKPYDPRAAVRSVEAVRAMLKGHRVSCPPELEWFGAGRPQSRTAH